TDPNAAAQLDLLAQLIGSGPRRSGASGFRLNLFRNDAEEEEAESVVAASAGPTPGARDHRVPAPAAIMVSKIMKAGRVVVVLSGRYAGRKAFIVKNYDKSGSDESSGKTKRNYSHSLVVGVDRYPRKITRSMGKKRAAKKTKLKPFIKIMNHNHVLPTRYVVDTTFDSKVVNKEAFKGRRGQAQGNGTCQEPGGEVQGGQEQKELMEVMTVGEKGLSAFPEGENLTRWTATLEGPAGTPYEGDVYKLSLEFPADYPYKSPRCPLHYSLLSSQCRPVRQHLLGHSQGELERPCTPCALSCCPCDLCLTSPNNDSPLNAQAASLWCNPAKFAEKKRAFQEQQRSASTKYAGRKAFIVKNYDKSGSDESSGKSGQDKRNYSHSLVVGVDRYPRKITRSMGKKRAAKKTKLKPFIKIMNHNHVLPTRYVVDTTFDSKVVNKEAFKDAAAKRKAMALVKSLEEKYKAGKNKWFFTKLRFLT
uniref:Large ribosomal subunit protein eL27 n=1 Tax=Macrostomum lignano TaxID=282301 RepID=A0A1I8IN02_9PLAT